MRKKCEMFLFKRTRPTDLNLKFRITISEPRPRHPRHTGYSKEHIFHLATNNREKAVYRSNRPTIPSGHPLIAGPKTER